MVNKDLKIVIHVYSVSLCSLMPSASSSSDVGGVAAVKLVKK